MKLEWLTNRYDPNHPNARNFYEGDDVQWKFYQEWLRDKIIGPPKPSSDYTVAQLQGMHMVGVYRKQGDEGEYCCGYNTVSGAFHKPGCNGECGFMNPGEAVKQSRIQRRKAKR
jgi:hypothetical protein